LVHFKWHALSRTHTPTHPPTYPLSFTPQVLDAAGVAQLHDMLLSFFTAQHHNVLTASLEALQQVPVSVWRADYFDNVLFLSSVFF
jgi:hypothetical protein